MSRITNYVWEYDRGRLIAGGTDCFIDQDFRAGNPCALYGPLRDGAHEVLTVGTVDEIKAWASRNLCEECGNTKRADGDEWCLDCQIELERGRAHAE